MYFTKSEKQAIYFLLVHMSIIDNGVDAKEIMLTTIICNKLNISDIDRKESSNIDIDDALEIVDNMTSTEKEFVCAALGAMIAIDGEIKPREMLFWNLISTRCEFPDMNLIEAAEKFQKYIKE